MHDNQLYEDVQAKHAFLMQNAAEWRQTQNGSVKTQRSAPVTKQLRLVLAAMLNVFTK